MDYCKLPRNGFARLVTEVVTVRHMGWARFEWELVFLHYEIRYLQTNSTEYEEL